MRFEHFNNMRKAVKVITLKNLLFLHYLITEEIKKRGGDIKVLEELKEI